MRHTARRAQGSHPERVTDHSPSRSTPIVAQDRPSFAWPIARTIPLQGGRSIELIASSLGPVGLFYQGQFVAQVDPAELAALAAIAAELAADLQADRAARARMCEVPHG